MDYSSMKATKKKKYSYEKDADFEISRSNKRKIKKGLKKLNIFLAVIFLAVGVAAGFLGLKLAFSKDKFVINAGTMVDEVMFVGEGEAYAEYVELGATCIAFGKDYSKDVEIKYYYRQNENQDYAEVESVDSTKSGMYYAVYTTKAARYKSVTLIRNIYVVEVEG